MREKNDLDLPDPRKLVRPAWLPAEERARLIGYLDSGHVYETWRGFSDCRLGCAGNFGHRDFSDGRWVWPEGLSHYVESHDVMLPDTFVAHGRAADWSIPSTALLDLEVTDNFDFTGWRNWAAQVGNLDR